MARSRVADHGRPDFFWTLALHKSFTYLLTYLLNHCWTRLQRRLRARNKHTLVGTLRRTGSGDRITRHVVTATAALAAVDSVKSRFTRQLAALSAEARVAQASTGLSTQPNRHCTADS